MDPAVAERIEEERARQPMLQAAGRVGGFILEVDRDAGESGQVQPLEMRVGGAREVRFDPADRLVGPVAIGHGLFSPT